MASHTPVVSILGSPGAGKSTLGDLLTKRCPVQHVSVGNLLRRIKDDGTDPQAEVIASQLSRQELINAKVLVPILKAELDKLRLQNPARPVILVDGFPRNMAQLMEFETEAGAPILVLSFHCPKNVAKERYLTRKLEGREADDEAMFEKRYQEYVQENDGIARDYRERGLLVDVETGKKQQQVIEELCCTLQKDKKWMGAGFGSSTTQYI